MQLIVFAINICNHTVCERVPFQATHFTSILDAAMGFYLALIHEWHLLTMDMFQEVDYRL